MSAVLKEESGDTVIVEQKSLAEILVVSEEIPADFYKNTAKYQAEIDTAIEHAKSLVHPITDEGRKLAKSDAALIRKFAKNRNVWSLEVFRSLTEKVKFWRDDITGKTKVLEQEADKILTRFEEHEAKQLSEIRKTLISFLNKTRSESSSLRDEFISDSSSFIEKLKKLSAVTPAGSLTGATKKMLKGFVDAELTLQSTHDNRILTIENRCLRADINPPLGKVHLGNDFWETDAIFEAKLDQLVDAEIARREEMAERIKRDLEKQEQAKIDAAIAKERQEAAQKAAHEKAEQEAKEKALEEAKNPTPEKLREQASRIVDRAVHADRNSDMRRELQDADELIAQAKDLEKAQETVEMLAADGKKLVKVTVIFENNEIRERLHFKLNSAVKSSKTTIEFEFSAGKDIPVQKVVDGVIGLLPDGINLLSIIGE